MNIHLQILPLATLAAGILILLRPKLLNYVVAIWLIATALFGPGGLVH